MAWSIPEYPRDKVNAAGNVLRDTSGAVDSFEKEAALLMINNWRTCHNFPLNTLQVRLRKKAKEVDPGSLVVQRIKRLASIKLKLERFPSLKLTQMQDIGGCRAVVNSIDQVDQLVEIYKHGSRGMKHKLDKENDYIATPKSSGYRGVHLIYRYQSIRNAHFKDLRIEIQIRTFIQHAWATAVETVGTFIRQSLKSSQGEKEWLDFFILMSSALAMKENKPLVPGTPSDLSELKNKIVELEKQLSVIEHLMAFRDSIKILESKEIANAHYYLMLLDVKNRSVNVTPYTQNQLSQASEKYLELEEKNLDKNVDIVLVSADSVDALKVAYPNYYLDTDLFLKALKEFIGQD